MRIRLNSIFPIKIQTNILQLEGYDYSRLIRWVSRHYFDRKIPIKKPLVITSKIKTIYTLSIVWLMILGIAAYLLTSNLIFSIIVSILLLTQPYILLGLSLLLLKPPEYVFKKKVINKTKSKIISLKNLNIIAVTGSYGKSSTKEILYYILRDKYKILRTPESFNTVLGIAKVVDLELDKNYDYFICEMAAFKKGEIKELCKIIPPQFGIITGISKQHLERFKTLNNIVHAKFELADSISDSKKISFNLDDKNILNELKRRGIKIFRGYGVNNTRAKTRAENIKFGRNGSSFTLIINKNKFDIKTSLFGFSNINNILAATSMAVTLGLPSKHIVERIIELNQIPNRSSLYNINDTTFVDNTYSSNPKGFLETIRTAKLIDGVKILVTPGLVELGSETKKIHYGLGKKAAKVFNKVILVGKNTKTSSFAKGFANRKNIKYIKDTREDYFKVLKELKGNSYWVFLENDITQNY